MDDIALKVIKSQKTYPKQVELNEKAVAKINKFIDSIDWEDREKFGWKKPKPISNHDFYAGLLFGIYDCKMILKQNPRYILSKPVHSIQVTLQWVETYTETIGGKKYYCFMMLCLFYDGGKWLKFHDIVQKEVKE